MDWYLTDVRLDGEHTLWVRFRDGLEGVVRFMPSSFRGVFARLSDQVEFGRVAIVDGVLTWPGEIDLAPDAMHKQISLHGIWILT